MNNSIPGWNFESDSCVINQKNPIWPDQELVELLWQNGQVVFQSQTQRKPIENSYDSRKVQKNDPSTLRTSESFGNSSSLSQQDDIVSWIQYPVEDPLEQQLSSNLLSQLAPCEVESFKPIKQLEEGKFAKFDASSAPNATLSSQPPNMRPSSNHMPAPRFHHAPVSASQKINDFGGSSRKAPKFSHFSAPPNGSSASANALFRGKVNANVSQGEARECSVMTVGSSHCGSNHIPQEQDVSKVSSSGVWGTTFSAEHEAVRDCVQRTVPWSGKGISSEMLEPTLTSSSGGSGSSSLGKTCSLSTGNHGLKRKATDADELEELSEATEPNSAVGNKQASQQSGSSRRNRSAKVHNLSERRRRDRINEKMKALQQLIPNSNKTDKASVLEEAIEYMKSLQFQLQVMWMGAGMAPVMFPGIQRYFPQMCMGIAAPPIQHPMQLPRMPLDQSMSVAQAQNKARMCQNPVLGAFSYQNQMQNPCLAEQYARYMMAYHPLMQSASRPMNVFGYGSHGVQPNQTMIAPSNGSGTMSGAANFDDANAMSGKMGKLLSTSCRFLGLQQHIGIAPTLLALGSKVGSSRISRVSW